jgi:hypothetical protein
MTRLYLVLGTALVGVLGVWTITRFLALDTSWRDMTAGAFMGAGIAWSVVRHRRARR